ncbi:transcriptional regulator [Cladochytrium replicatum]|nr:transcriptional regulator [Cladochytrium replicatum]
MSGILSPPVDPTHELTIAAVLFPGFAPLDLFGPIEFLNALSAFTNIKIILVSEHGGTVSSKPEPNKGPSMMSKIKAKRRFLDEDLERSRKMSMANVAAQRVDTDYSFEQAQAINIDILFIPGGSGTRSEINNDNLISFIRQRGELASLILTVCTGAALAAKAGLLEGKKATTNKWLFGWVASATEGCGVDWVTKARWVEDGKIISSSGVAAGMDMINYFIEKFFDKSLAQRIADSLEYEPQTSPEYDSFYSYFGLDEVDFK